MEKMKKLILLAGALALIAALRSIIVSGIHSNNTVFLGGIAAALFVYGYFYEKLIKIKWLTAAIFAAIFAVVGFSVFLGVYGRRSTVTYNEDVIIVLGAGIRDSEVRSVLASRLERAVDYHRQNPSAMIIVSGGLGHGETFTEAEVMAWFLIDRGVPSEMIILEDHAYSTYTNMVFSRRWIDAVFESTPSAVVVTSDFHMYRSVRFARYVGLDAAAYPSRTPWYSAPFAYLREVASVVKMWVIGT